MIGALRYQMGDTFDNPELKAHFGAVTHLKSMSSYAEKYISKNYVFLRTWPFKYPAEMSHWNALEPTFRQDGDNTVSQFFHPQMHNRNKEVVELSNVTFPGCIFSLSNITIDSMLGHPTELHSEPAYAISGSFIRNLQVLSLRTC